MHSPSSTPKKTKLHPRNKNRLPYDLQALSLSTPDLARYIKPNKHGFTSVDFSNPKAVKLLNKALLNHYYGIQDWNFSDDHLCPPIPGRADYIHYMADLLAENNSGRIPKGNQIKGIDIGVGATCIYPIIGVAEYNWQFVGSDIDINSIISSQKIVASNSLLKNKIDCRKQKNASLIFKGILNKDEKVDFVISNPPFHSSIKEAQKGTVRKVKNLSGKKEKSTELNFSGNQNELVYEGGEYQFIANMINESKLFSKNCLWFTTLVSKESNLKAISKLLNNVNASKIKVIPMGTGNKTSRIVAWTFLDEAAQRNWIETRWNT